MFLGLMDPDPDPLVRGMDPDPTLDLDPSIIKKIVRKPWFLLVVTTVLFDFLSLKIYEFLSSKSKKQKNFKNGSTGPDPDPHQNVMDPQHCWIRSKMEREIRNQISI